MHRIGISHIMKRRWYECNIILKRNKIRKTLTKSKNLSWVFMLSMLSENQPFKYLHLSVFSQLPSCFHLGIIESHAGKSWKKYKYYCKRCWCCQYLFISEWIICSYILKIQLTVVYIWIYIWVCCHPHSMIKMWTFGLLNLMVTLLLWRHVFCFASSFLDALILLRERGANNTEDDSCLPLCLKRVHVFSNWHQFQK